MGSVVRSNHRGYISFTGGGCRMVEEVWGRGQTKVTGGNGTVIDILEKRTIEGRSRRGPYHLFVLSSIPFLLSLSTFFYFKCHALAETSLDCESHGSCP